MAQMCKVCIKLYQAELLSYQAFLVDSAINEYDNVIMPSYLHTGKLDIPAEATLSDKLVITATSTHSVPSLSFEASPFFGLVVHSSHFQTCIR